MDGLSVAVYRNGSFLITMIPLLWFAGWEEIEKVQYLWQTFLFSGIFGAVGLSFSLGAQKYLPVGIVSSMSQMSPLFLILWGILWKSEFLSTAEILFIGILITGVIILVRQKHHLPHLQEKTGIGLSFTLISAIGSSLTAFFIDNAVEQMSPFAVAYFWEGSIAIFAFLFVMIREKAGFGDFKRVSFEKIKKIAWASSPTILASVAFPFAMSLGIAGLAGSIVNATGVLVITGLGFLFYNEKLKKLQIVGIAIIVVGMIGMKFVG